MANQGVVILQMGDNHAANHDNENHEALPQPPPSLAQAIAALIADRNEQTELMRQLVQANTGRGRQAPPPPAKTDYVGFWPPNHLCSTRQMIPSKPMHGFALLRTSLVSSIAQK